MKLATFEDISNWEREAGESFFDYHENLINSVFFLGYTLGKYPDHFQRIFDCFNDGVDSLVDLLAFDYNENGDYIELENNITYIIFLEIVNTSEIHNKRFWAIFDEENQIENEGKEQF